MDWLDLEEFKNKPVLNYFNDPLSLIEFNKEITKIILNKASGLNGVSHNAIKALDVENRLILFQICSDFVDSNVEIEDWKIGNLKILPKKRDSSNPNNWRGINLLDVVSKLMPIIINTRTQVALKHMALLYHLEHFQTWAVLKALFLSILCYKCVKNIIYNLG